MGEKVNMVLILHANSHQMFVFVFVFARQRKDGSHLPTDTYKVLLRAVNVFWGESLRFSHRLGPPHRFYINLRNSFCFAQILWSPDSTMTTILCQFPFLTGSAHWACCWHIVTLHHTCKKRVIPVIYHRNFFLDFPQNFRLRTRNQYCTQAIAWGSTI